MCNMGLDEFDLKIIDALQNDGRLSNMELAERITYPTPVVPEGYPNWKRKAI